MKVQDQGKEKYAEGRTDDQVKKRSEDSGQVLGGSDIRFEVFRARGRLLPVSLHCYRLLKKALRFEASVKEEIPADPEDFYPAVCRLRNVAKGGIFHNQSFIYTTELLDVERICREAGFGLKYIAKQEPPIKDNLQMYAEIVRYYILKKLNQVLIFHTCKKYQVRWDVTSRWFSDGGVLRTFEQIRLENNGITGNESTGRWITGGEMTERGSTGRGEQSQERRELMPSVRIVRRYDFRVEVTEAGEVYLWPDTGSRLECSATIADYLKAGKKVEGMRVMNDWADFPEYGEVQALCGERIDQELPFGRSLREYYREIKREGYRVEHLPADTPVVAVRMRKGDTIYCCPQALKPVISMTEEQKKFFRKNMRGRILLDQDLIRDIGKLDILEEVRKQEGDSFEDRTCAVSSLGYKRAFIQPPVLLGEGGTPLLTKEKQEVDRSSVFRIGFFEQSGRELNIGYLYPKGAEADLKQVANRLYLFAARQEKILLPMICRPAAVFSYDETDGEACRSAAERMQQVRGVNFVITLIPGREGEQSDAYACFKEIWKQKSLPSQMISIGTAKKLPHMNEKEQKEVLGNVTLGILTKTGGIPWVLKEVRGRIGLILGIHEGGDISILDRQGKLLGKGSLEDLRRFVSAYRRTKGNFSKQLLLLCPTELKKREGQAVEKVLRLEGAPFTRAWIKEECPVRMLREKEGKVYNPEQGDVIYKEENAYLITRFIPEQEGSPRPIYVEKEGCLSIAEVLTCIYDLSYLAPEAVEKRRLWLG